MYEQILAKWKEAILSDAGYKKVLKATKPGAVKRRDLLAEVLDPYKGRILKDVKESQAGKAELAACMGCEQAAYQRAYAFGGDFILSMREPEFEGKSEEEKDAMRYQAAFFYLVWDRLYAELIVS